MTGMENTMIWDFVWRLVLAGLLYTSKFALATGIGRHDDLLTVIEQAGYGFYLCHYAAVDVYKRQAKAFA